MRRRYAPARLPQHVVQRGVNRSQVFFDDARRREYLALLGCASRLYGCAIHAYVLMHNHTHVLKTPEQPGALSGMIQWVGARSVADVNASTHRTGSLWEGRFWSSAVTSDRYVLACHRYIELNPVRAGLATDPAQYRWSSYRHKALGADDPLLAAHACYRSLGLTAANQQCGYRSLVATGLAVSDLADIRDALNGRRRLGTMAPGAGHLRRGRPPKRKDPAHPQNGSEPISEINGSEPISQISQKE